MVCGIYILWELKQMFFTSNLLLSTLYLNDNERYVIEVKHPLYSLQEHSQDQKVIFQ